MSPTTNGTEIRSRLHTLIQKRNKNQSLQDVLEVDISDDAFPLSPSLNILTNEVVYYLTQPEVTGKAYSDLTGRFPHRSSRGNEYLLVGYHFDANAILATPIKNRQAGTIADAWQKQQNKFTVAGIAPHIWVLDNEASQELKNAM